jgi:hypothetical protein
LEAVLKGNYNKLHDEEGTQHCGSTFVRNMDLAGAVYRSEKIYFCAKSNL